MPAGRPYPAKVISSIDEPKRHEIRACAAPFSHADVHDGRNSSAGGGGGGGGLLKFGRAYPQSLGSLCVRPRSQPGPGASSVRKQFY